MSDVLARICADKRAEVARRRREVPLAALESRLGAEPARPFVAALRRDAALHGIGLVAEIKKASPSRGVIRADFDPPALARAYAAGGASCLSVLTDGPYFQGADAYLAAARAAVPLPCLRKDFTLDPYQVIEARAIGADAILLIVAALGDGQAGELLATARGLGLDVLVEVHDGAELERALRLEGEWLLGINNRNLKTLRVDLAVTEELAARVPPGTPFVAESGLAGHADVERMRRAGAVACLVGERLMAEADVRAATLRLLGRAAA